MTPSGEWSSRCLHPKVGVQISRNHDLNRYLSVARIDHLISPSKYRDPMQLRPRPQASWAEWLQNTILQPMQYKLALSYMGCSSVWRSYIYFVYRSGDIYILSVAQFAGIFWLDSQYELIMVKRMRASRRFALLIKICLLINNITNELSPLCVEFA